MPFFATSLEKYCPRILSYPRGRDLSGSCTTVAKALAALCIVLVLYPAAPPGSCSPVLLCLCSVKMRRDDLHIPSFPPAIRAPSSPWQSCCAVGWLTGSQVREDAVLKLGGGEGKDKGSHHLSAQTPLQKFFRDGVCITFPNT